MDYQSELQLEDTLVKQLTTLGYETISINDVTGMRNNLKKQLEKLNQSQLAKFNQTKFTDDEFKQILNELAKGSVFDKAILLRDQVVVYREDGSYYHIKFLYDDFKGNSFQITQQVSLYHILCKFIITNNQSLDYQNGS